jgi:hypothetical protein
LLAKKGFILVNIAQILAAWTVTELVSEYSQHVPECLDFGDEGQAGCVEDSQYMTNMLPWHVL